MSQRQRFHCIDGIKGIALAAIVAYHFSIVGESGGFLGVETLFTISGFLLTWSLLNEYEDHDGIRFGRYYLRRAVRLLPAIVLLIPVVALLSVAIDTDALVKYGAESLAAITFTYNWYGIASGTSYFATTAPQPLQHLWYVAVFAQFAVLLPLLVMLIRKYVPEKMQWLVPAGLAVLSAVLMGVLYTPGRDATRVYYGLDTHTFGLLAGMAFAWSLHSTLQVTVSQRFADIWMKTTPWLATAALAAFIALTRYVRQDASAFRWGLALTAVLTILMLVGSIGEESWMAGLFEWQPLRMMGRYSYGLYLWHWPIYVLFERLIPAAQGGHPQWLLWILAWGMTMACAAFSWHFVEQPAARLLEGWRPDVSGTKNRVKVAVAAIVAVALCAGFAYILHIAPDKTKVQLALDQQKALLAEQHRQAPQSAQNPAEPATQPPTADESSQDKSDTTEFDKSESSGKIATNSTVSGETKNVQQPPQPIVPVNGGDVIAIGDSVMLGASSALSAALPGIYVDAKESRSIMAVPDLIATYKANGQLKKYIVIAANTNGVTTVEQYEKIASMAGPGHVLCIISAHGDRTWIPVSNQASRDYVDAHRDSSLLIDWDAAATSHPEVFYSDGIHTMPDGANLYAATVCDALNAWSARH